MSDEYLTFEQASALLNTPRSTLYRWLKEGRVPGHKLGRQWRFLRSELEHVRARPVEDQEREGAHDQDARLALRALLDTLDAEGAGPSGAQTSLRELLLWGAFARGVTAIHIEPLASGSWALSERAQGGLERKFELDEEQVALLLDAVLEEVGPGEPREQGQRRWKMWRDEAHMVVKAQEVETALGARWTLRLIRSRGEAPSIEEIAREEHVRALLKRFCGMSHGLLLISGPSHSGKTTTAYSCLRELARGETRAIFALESMTDTLIPGVNQVSVDLDDERAYRAAFEQVMNADPDVLFMASTFAPRHRQVIYTTALNAAESGHLVLVQLEAESAEDALARFQQQVERPVDDWVVGVVWQELVRDGEGRIAPRYELLPGPLDVGA